MASIVELQDISVFPLKHKTLAITNLNILEIGQQQNHVNNKN